ncbi:MAG: FUSC family protein [Pararhizobium sp.]
MTRPAPWQIVFSLKAFAAAMLALYIAFAADLSNPYWALTTVYVVSQPYAGAIRSKATFRIVGTLMGAAVGIALGGLFGAAQLPMIAGLVLWFCFCGYFAISERSPRNYMFLLGGMTALLVGWPSSAAPAVFATAVARTEEITLGILCALFVDSIFLPRRIGPVVGTQIRTWFADARTWASAVLAGRTNQTSQDRRKLAADAQQIATMALHLSFEKPENRTRARWIDLLLQRMLLLMPVFSSMEDRLSELRRDGRPLPDDVERAIGRFDGWLADGAAPEALPELKRTVNAIAPRSDATSDWHQILLVSLVDRMREMLNLWGECAMVWEQVKAPERPVSRRLRSLGRHRISGSHNDPWMTAWALAASLLSFFVAAAFWYMTGWPQGSSAALMALLMSLFFGAMDDPMPMLRMLIKVLVFATVLDTLYLFVLMPMADSFPVLVLLFAPALIPLGLLASNPATFMVALMPVAMMQLTSTPMDPSNFSSYVNGMVGTLTGVTIVLVVTGIVKTASAEFSVRRIAKAGWRDIENIASAKASDREVRHFTGRMLDRIALLVPRLATLDAASSLATHDALSDLRLGLNLIELQRHRGELQKPAADAVSDLLAGVAGHYRALREKQPVAEADLLPVIDHALSEASAQEQTPHKARIVLTIAGVRRALFPNAEPYSPPPPESEAIMPMPMAAE